MKLLTVIVPLYNKAEYIEECINSILIQNIVEFDLIIIDDGSTDNSGIICDRMAEEDSRITVIHQSNKGPIFARYTGIKQCKTKYVTFVDADDFICAGAYDEAVLYMEQEYDQIFYEISRYYNNNNIHREHHVLSPGIYDRERIVNEVYPILMWDFKNNTPGIECSQCVRVIKKELLLSAYSRFDGLNIYYGEDMAITYPTMCETNDLVVVPNSYYMHRQREEGIVPIYIKSSSFFENVHNLFSFLRRVMQNETYDFSMQIDYLYIYSVEMKKKCYELYKHHKDVIFPFGAIDRNKNIVLYGAGEIGKIFFEQLNRTKYCKSIIWIDKNADYIADDHVQGLSKLDDDVSHNADYIVVAIENKNISREVKECMVKKGFSNDKIVLGV